jgi:hypothetical protein
MVVLVLVARLWVSGQVAATVVITGHFGLWAAIPPRNGQ